MKWFTLAAKNKQRNAKNALEEFHIREEGGIRLITEAMEMPYSKLKNMTESCFDAASAKKAIFEERHAKTEKVKSLKSRLPHASASGSKLTPEQQKIQEEVERLEGELEACAGRSAVCGLFNLLLR